MNETMKTTWDSKDVPLDVVWASKLDGRYVVEVQRVSDYMGAICIFDHEDSDKLLISTHVGLSYGARFGPDISDVDAWQEMATNFVDTGFLNTGNAA